MEKIETLTAYKCKFCYLQRCNTLTEQQKKALQVGKPPKFSFSAFIDLYLKYTEKLAIGEKSDRAIILRPDKVETTEKKDIKIWHIMPEAGKQGKPVTVIKKTGKKYDFGSDSAALYEHHIFVYESKGEIIAIFHRQNGSGCKSVFLETANKSIKSKGLRLEMELITPLMDGIKDATATKITLQYRKTDESTDIADNINGLKKKQIIRDLGLNLEAIENHKISDLIRKMQLGKIDQAKAFALIKTELGDSDDYNDAEIRLRIGKRSRKVQWNEFESIIGAHDITNDLYKEYRKSKDFVGELSKLSYSYYKDIISSEEV